jgi:carnitine 3-dehydrogenase
VVCDTVEEALDGATFVQENAPENMDTKHAMLRQIDEALPTDVIVGSSTSSFLLVDMVAKCTRAPSRFVLSHPFNREPPPPLPPPLPLPQPSARCSILCGRSVQLRT